MRKVISAGWSVMWTLAAVVCASLMSSQASAAEYGVSRWPAIHGNHRAVVSVTESAPAVWAHLEWRRRDDRPMEKDVLVVDLKTGKFIRNVAKVNMTQDFGDIFFEPQTVPGEYAIYYYPLKRRERRPLGTTNHEYAERMDVADDRWLEENGLNPGRYFEANAFADIPKARVLRFEARSELDQFGPMALPATQEEIQRLHRFNSDKEYLLFFEDRSLPVRMREKLPASWAQRAAGHKPAFTADKGEWYPFQIGVYAHGQSLKNVQASWSDLENGQGGTIPAQAVSCITLGGVDAGGQPMTRRLDVPQNEVRVLWFMVRVPKDAASGQYAGKVTLTPENGAPQTVDLTLNITDSILEDGGVEDIRRLSRLAWLDSTAGQEDTVTYPYQPMTVEGRSVRSISKEIVLGDDGFPQALRVGGQDVLASPIHCVAINPVDKPMQWRQSELTFETQSASVVAWRGVSKSGGLTLQVRGRMEYDGYIFLAVTLEANYTTQLKDVRIHIPYRLETAEYFMGLGQGSGGYRPDREIKWQWSDRPTNKVWMGSVEAGLQVKLRGPAQEENIWSNYKPEESGIPDSWHNGGKGGATVIPAQDHVMLTAYTGPVTVVAGKSRELSFSLIPTPVKPRDPNHWADPKRWNLRYSMLASVSPKQVKALGANDVTAFHATPANPWINYPFVADDRLKSFVKEAHENGLNARLYYTVRELSNHAAEFWPLWSMREEFFAPGPGGGGPWLREHLRASYSPAWSCTPEGDEGNPDDSLHVSGWNRWLNYYVESLNWLMEERQVDGLYFDGISCGRKTLQRLRRVGDAGRPNFRMDFHSGNTITRRSNAFNDCLELLPYMDSTWIGEGFNYNGSPDYYMVELSGIPFGIPNDMLQYGGNAWRGMLYGMVPRYIENHAASPTSMWNFWDQIGIEQSRMIGYWDKQSPVKTHREDVLATVYQMPGKTLIAIASWAKEDVACKLDINWEALGMDASKVTAYAPRIAEFQEMQTFDLSASWVIPQGRGFLIVLTDQPVEKAVSNPVVSRSVEVPLSSLSDTWEWKIPPGSDGQRQITGDTLVTSGSRNTYAFLQHQVAAGVTGIQTQIQVSHLKVERVWHDRHDGMNAPGLAVVFESGKTVRVSLSSRGVAVIEDGIIDHMYKPVLALRNQPEDAWIGLRITWDNEHIHVACSLDGQVWETVRELPRSIFGEPRLARIGKIGKDYGWPRTLQFQNTGGVHTGLFRELRWLLAADDSKR